MTISTLVFALEVSYWDAPAGSGSADVIATPNLTVFPNAVSAATGNEGINIAEGDLWFFAADGSPLEAVFSEQPYVDTKRLRYFSGRYFLQAGHGKTLREMILSVAPGISTPGARIIVGVMPSNEDVHEYGWPDVEAVKSEIHQTLELAIPDLTKLVVFE